MKKRLIILILSVFCHFLLKGQGKQTDSLLRLLEKAPRDTNRVWLFLKTAQTYYFSKPDTCLLLSLKGLELSRQLAYKKGELNALNKAGESYRFLGDYPKALDMQFQANQLAGEMKDIDGEAGSKGFIGFTYMEMGEYRKALEYLLAAKPVFDHSHNTVSGSFVSSHIGYCYTQLNIPDSAHYFNQEAYRLLLIEPYPPLRTLVYDRLGSMNEKEGNFSEAVKWYQQSLYFSNLSGIKVNISKCQKLLASLYFKEGMMDSAMYYARKAFANSTGSLQKPHSLDASLLLSQIFSANKQTDSAFYYLAIAMEIKDSIYGAAQFRKIQLLVLEEQTRQQELIKDQTTYRNRIKYAALIILLGFLASLVFIQRRNSAIKQKNNQALEVEKKALQQTLTDLKSAQSQLIQSEKMASLGELTAGIAHEIQNPLNFVNNFAEINNELIEDLKEAAIQNDQREVNRLADQLQENEQKIKIHGKRADSIVKSMLQHSRAGSGQKELTDINKMVDEYVRLSFHGMRAKDKSFNTELDMQLDPAAGKISVMPQDFGRVLLNLLNNAFYAVNVKRKMAIETYVPKVTIQTALHYAAEGQSKYFRIVIADNGMGIPRDLKDKIFQPFFTTKPTGEGTGLGLSLSYDIVKAHGGSLDVESIEGEGSSFFIQIPID